MKSIYLFLIPLLLISTTLTSRAQEVKADNKESVIDNEIIDVYYFHNINSFFIKAYCQ